MAAPLPPEGSGDSCALAKNEVSEGGGLQPRRKDAVSQISFCAPSAQAFVSVKRDASFDSAPVSSRRHYALSFISLPASQKSAQYP